MDHSISIQEFYTLHHRQLKLDWVSGENLIINIIPDKDENRDNPIIGYFNSIHPNQIQVLGQKEQEYFKGLDKEATFNILNAVSDPRKPIYITTKSSKLPDAILQYTQEKGIPVLSSALSGRKLIEFLRYYLTPLLSDQTIKHGVFMEVMGIGVLITGSSGIGKSELALELLSRGHRLIADDAPEFARSEPDTLHGSCPDALHGFIEVRGLSILNVRAMFGETATLQTKRLHLVINMELFSETELHKLNRLDTSEHYENILDVEIPLVNIPVAPGRNMAVIVEAAVRNHVLRLNGYNATEDFIKRQQKIINKRTV